MGRNKKLTPSRKKTVKKNKARIVAFYTEENKKKKAILQQGMERTANEVLQIAKGNGGNT